MNIVYWIIFITTVLEFTASPINTLLNSKPHLERLREVHFPITVAKFLAVIELIAVVGVIAGLWILPARRVGGIVLALCFLPILIWGVRAKRPASDLLALGFFMACALITAVFTA